MTHFVDTLALKEKIFILDNLALSGESFSTKYSIGVKKCQKYYSNSDYYQITKTIVSNYTIELAVKLRNAAELMDANDFQYMNEKIIVCYPIGIHADSHQEKRDLLYICNKIIHAKKFRIDAVSSTKYNADFKWWSGDLTISGNYQGNKQPPWEFFFSINSWCEAAISFINSSESSLHSINARAEDSLLFR